MTVIEHFPAKWLVCTSEQRLVAPWNATRPLVKYMTSPMSCFSSWKPTPEKHLLCCMEPSRSENVETTSVPWNGICKCFAKPTACHPALTTIKYCYPSFSNVANHYQIPVHQWYWLIMRYHYQTPLSLYHQTLISIINTNPSISWSITAIIDSPSSSVRHGRRPPVMWAPLRWDLPLRRLSRSAVLGYPSNFFPC